MTAVHIYGGDALLLDIRQMVLSQVGIHCVSSIVDDRALDVAPADVSIVCSSLPPATQEKVAEKLRQTYPEASVLMIRPSERKPTQLPSGVHLCGNDPEQITASCKRLLMLKTN